MTGRFPRAPKRHRIVECFTDCRAKETGVGADCDCRRRDAEAYADECERRYDAWKNGDYDDRGGRDE